MRRTTISRSSRTLVFTLAALVLGAPASPAQDTLQVAPEGEIALPPLPDSHTVERGETLWSIAQLLYGDPLLWPEIYRLNTAVVEDPHWIYPGEVLVFGAPTQVIAQGPDTGAVVPQGPGAADTVRATPEADTLAVPADTFVVDTTPVFVIEEPPPPPIAGYETIFDRPQSRTTEVQRILRAYAEQPYRPVRRGEFYRAGFLTENERLPFTKVLGNTAKPVITRLTPHSTAGAFDEIALEPPGDVAYHVGDSLLIVELTRTVTGWGEVVVPLGTARVTHVQERQVLAVVMDRWGQIRNGALALPLEPFRDPGRVRPTPVRQGLEGRLITQRDLHSLVLTQQFLFVDRGRSDGLVPGDMLEVYQPATSDLGSASEQVLVTLLVVHTRERSSTGMVIGVKHPALVPGTPVRLFKKMPS
jgi:hypothetical protein